ncbi:hypothetical protein ACFL2V_19900 [Pseudomonadota bacterium]
MTEKLFEGDAPPRSSIPPISIPQGTTIPDAIVADTKDRASSVTEQSPHAKTIDHIVTEGNILFGTDDDRGIATANDTRRALHFNYEERKRKEGLKFASFVRRTLSEARGILTQIDFEKEASTLAQYESVIDEIELNLAETGLRHMISQRDGLTDFSDTFGKQLIRLFSIHGFDIEDAIRGLVHLVKQQLEEEALPATQENLLEKYMDALILEGHSLDFDTKEAAGDVTEKQKPKKALQKLIHALENTDSASTAIAITNAIEILKKSIDVPLTFLEFDHIKAAGTRASGESISKKNLMLTVAAINRLLILKNQMFVLRRILESA